MKWLVKRGDADLHLRRWSKRHSLRGEHNYEMQRQWRDLCMLHLVVQLYMKILRIIFDAVLKCVWMDFNARLSDISIEARNFL